MYVHTAASNNSYDANIELSIFVKGAGRAFFAEELVHVHKVEAGVRAQQLHVEEVLEPHLVVRILVMLVLVSLTCHYTHTYTLLLALNCARPCIVLCIVVRGRTC